MVLKYAVSVNNARLDAIEDTIGTTPILRIRTGNAPDACADADTGDVLVAITLDSNWMADAADGGKAKAGTWSGEATGAGTVGHFRIYDSGDTGCFLQGNVGPTNNYDLTVSEVEVSIGQTLTVLSFEIAAGNV